MMTLALEQCMLALVWEQGMMTLVQVSEQGMMALVWEQGMMTLA